MSQLISLIFFSLSLYVLSETTVSCSNYNEIIESSAKIHGKVEKKGVLPLNLWWNVTIEQSWPKFKQDLQDLQVDYVNGTVYQGSKIPQFPLKLPTLPCYVEVNHKHKLIYIKNTKTGGNSISLMLKKGCQDEISEKTGKQLDFWCLDRPNTEDIPDAETAQRIWREYTVITTVRNPYSRAASAYSYLLLRRIELGTYEKEGCFSPRFDYFCFAPFLIALQTQKHECLNDEVLHDFVHQDEYYKCIVNSEGELAVDHVLSVENMEDDWESFVQDYGSIENREANKDPYYEILKKQPVKHINAVHPGESYAEKMYKKCGQTCLFGIAQYYKKDFEVLGYEDCIFKQ